MNLTNNKIKLLTYFLTFTHFTTIAQSNGGFEINGADGCRNASGTSFTIDPFNKGKVSSWNASHGTPQIQKSSSNCAAAEADVHSGTEAAFIFYSASNKEGIFQSIPIKKDESFNIALFAKGLNANSKVIIKFANGLANEDPAITGGNPNIPNPSSQQLVIEYALSNSWQEVRVDEIIADADYSQVWIYAMDGTILVDDFTFFKSCCEPYKLWQNITNPPNTYVNNYIKAGENVDGTQPIGKVIITADSEPIEFEAGKSIELLPGFETEMGAKFTAEIKNCGEKKLQIDIIEINVPVINLDKNVLCYRKFEASACYGSGNYTYSWTNDAGADRTDPTNTKRSKTLLTTSPQWLFLTVTDNVTQQSLTKTIHLPANEFSGALQFTLSNVITPDGDGINDDWMVIDPSRIGATKFGYSAYFYDVELLNSWGSVVHSKTKQSGKNGFHYNEIDWIGDQCALNTSTVWGVLDLENCTESQTISFTITIFCDQSSPPLATITNLSIDTAVITIFPNPSSSLIHINSSEIIKELNIFNNNGKSVYEILENQNPFLEINSNDLSAGQYLLKITLDSNQVIFRRFIKL